MLRKWYFQELPACWCQLNCFLLRLMEGCWLLAYLLNFSRICKNKPVITGHALKTYRMCCLTSPACTCSSSGCWVSLKVFQIWNNLLSEWINRGFTNTVFCNLQTRTTLFWHRYTITVLRNYNNPFLAHDYLTYNFSMYLKRSWTLLPVLSLLSYLFLSFSTILLWTLPQTHCICHLSISADTFTFRDILYDMILFPRDGWM